MTVLGRKQFRLLYLTEGDLSQGDASIIEILSDGISLTNIQSMSEAQFAKFQHDWHIIFIALNKCLGRLMARRPEPKPEKKSKKGAPEQPVVAAPPS